MLRSCPHNHHPPQMHGRDGKDSKIKRPTQTDTYFQTQTQQ